VSHGERSSQTAGSRSPVIQIDLRIHTVTTMVLSVITLAALTPLLATSTLQLQESAQKQQSQQSGLDEELKTEKCHLRLRASDRMSEARKQIVKDRIVVLRNGKVRGPTRAPGLTHTALRKTKD
jgi:hypothetical protein